MVSCTKHVNMHKMKVIRDYKRGNYNLINTALEAVDWNTFMEGNMQMIVRFVLKICLWT